MRHGSPSKTMTMPRRICVAGIAIKNRCLVIGASFFVPRARNSPEPARVKRSRDPLAFLRSLTAPSGEVRYSRTSRQTPVWVTAQAVMALSRKPLPLARVPRARRTGAPLPKPSATPTAAPARPAKPEKPRAPARRSEAAKRGRDASAGTGGDAASGGAGAPAGGAPGATAAVPASTALASTALATVLAPDRARAAGFAAGMAAAALL